MKTIALSCLAVAACGVAACASSDPATSSPAGGPAASPVTPATPGPTAVTAHGFALHESLVRVCSQTVTAPPPGGEVHFTLYASPRPAAELASWYGERLPATSLERGADTWTWRLPSAVAPQRVLSLRAAGRGGAPSCGVAPPADAQALVDVSEMPGR